MSINISRWRLQKFIFTFGVQWECHCVRHQPHWKTFLSYLCTLCGENSSLKLHFYVWSV